MNFEFLFYWWGENTCSFISESTVRNQVIVWKPWVCSFKAGCQHCISDHLVHLEVALFTRTWQTGKRKTCMNKRDSACAGNFHQELITCKGWYCWQKNKKNNASLDKQSLVNASMKYSSAQCIPVCQVSLSQAIVLRHPTDSKSFPQYEALGYGIFPLSKEETIYLKEKHGLGGPDSWKSLHTQHESWAGYSPGGGTHHFHLLMSVTSSGRDVSAPCPLLWLIGYQLIYSEVCVCQLIYSKVCVLWCRFVLTQNWIAVSTNDS